MALISDEKPYPLSIYTMPFLVSILATLFLPNSGEGLGSLELWWDQSLMLKALFAANGSQKDVSIGGLIGPGFTASAKILQNSLLITPQQALILLARLSFGGTIFLLASMPYMLSTRRCLPREMTVSMLMVLVPCLSVWAISSDIPWTHFSTTFWITLIFALSLVQRIAGRVQFFAYGFICVLLWQTRAFEAQVLAIAVVISTLIYVFRFRSIALSPQIEETRALLLALMVGGSAALVAVGALTGYWLPFSQYPDHQSVMRLSLLDFPTKFVQLFIDPCFFSFCTDADYGPSSIYPLNRTSWQQPLILQLPALAAAFIALLFLAAAAPIKSVRLIASDFRILVAILMACGIVVAYTSGTISGSLHLKFGFFRDYVAAMALFSIAFVLFFYKTVNANAEDENVPSKFFKIVPFKITATLSIVIFGMSNVGLAALRPHGFVRLNSWHLKDYVVREICVSQVCNLSMSVSTVLGNAYRYDGWISYEQLCNDSVLPLKVIKMAEYAGTDGSCDNIRIGPVGWLGSIESSKLNGYFTKNSSANVVVTPRLIDLSSSDSVVLSPSSFQQASFPFGWSGIESSGIWTSGNKAVLTLDVGSVATSVELKGELFMTEKFSKNTMRLTTDGTNTQVISMEMPTTEVAASILLPRDRKTHVISIEIELDETRSPMSLGVNRDKRELGFFLRSVEARH